MTSSLARLATATATTKRNPAAVANKVGEPVDYLTVPFPIVPPVPDPADTDPRYRLNSMRQGWVSYVETSPARDIRKGDVLVALVDSIETQYRVTETHPWPILITWTELKLEKVLQT